MELDECEDKLSSVECAQQVVDFIFGRPPCTQARETLVGVRVEGNLARAVSLHADDDNAPAS